MLAGGVTQINIVVGTIIASLQPGAVSWLYYADRLYQLPLGIVGIAIGVVLLPDLAARASRRADNDVVDHTQNRSIEFAAALTLPAAVALLVIPAPIIAVLFQRGAFTAADTAATAPALAAYAVGLPAFVAIKVLQPGFFAREDTRTPMWYGVVSMVVNVVARLRALLALRPCRHRRRDLDRRLGQYRAAAHGRLSRAAISTSTPTLQPPPAAAGARLGADGRRCSGSPPWWLAPWLGDREPVRRGAARLALWSSSALALFVALLPAYRRRRFPPASPAAGASAAAGRDRRLRRRPRSAITPPPRRTGQWTP